MCVLMDPHGERLAPGTRNMEECRALAQGIDQLLAGDYLRAGDTLIQRFKAVTGAARDGWDSARLHQITPDNTVGVIPEEERRWTAKEAALRARTDRVLAPTTKARAPAPPPR